MRLAHYIRNYIGKSKALTPIDAQECEEGSTENWQEHATYIVKDFFNMMRDKFESLNFVSDGSITHNVQQGGETDKREREKLIFSTQLAISPTEVRFTAQDIDNWNEKLRNIFREHGWPSESYKKEKCLEKVQKVDEEIRDGYVQAYRARVAAKQEEKKRQAGNGEVEKEEGDNDH